MPSRGLGSCCRVSVLGMAERAQCRQHRSGVEKLTWSSLRGVSNRNLFAYKNGRFASRFLLLGIGFLEASKNLSETPFKPDRVSFSSPEQMTPIVHISGEAVSRQISNNCTSLSCLAQIELDRRSLIGVLQLVCTRQSNQ